LLTIFRAYIFYPDTPEAGSGFIDSITVSTDVAVPLSPSIVSHIIGLGFFALLGWLKKRKAAAQPPNR
jgi:hypothetical protein